MRILRLAGVTTPCNANATAVTGSSTLSDRHSIHNTHTHTPNVRDLLLLQHSQKRRVNKTAHDRFLSKSICLLLGDLPQSIKFLPSSFCRCWNKLDPDTRGHVNTTQANGMTARVKFTETQRARAVLVTRCRSTGNFFVTNAFVAAVVPVYIPWLYIVVDNEKYLFLLFFLSSTHIIPTGEQDKRCTSLYFRWEMSLGIHERENSKHRLRGLNYRSEWTRLSKNHYSLDWKFEIAKENSLLLFEMKLPF